MIRNLKIKFVLIIMLLLTIVLTTLLAGLFMYQKNQLYVDSVNAMKEAMVLQADTQSSLYYELFGLYSRSSRYPYFNTFVLEVDRIDKTVTAIGYEEELDDERFLRCHQSYLVNMDHISQVDKQFILMTGEAVLIRQRDLKAMRQTYLDYMAGKTQRMSGS